MRCLASLSHARRTFASATAGVFGFLVTPTTGTPSTASTKSHRSTPFAISGHSAANDARSAPSGSYARLEARDGELRVEVVRARDGTVHDSFAVPPRR